MKEKWENFLEAFYQVAHHGKMIRGVLERAAQLGEAVELYNSSNCQAHIEGRKNLWILKPGTAFTCLPSNAGTLGAMSRGRGISVYSNLKLITQAVRADMTTTSNTRWVAQKYIERPLLIHGVKFDIRQWFVVTDWEQLTIWMYRNVCLHLNFSHNF